MSNATYIGKRVRDFDSSPQFDGFSKVVLVVSEDVEYSSGTDIGRTLTLECPWGTQVMADNILASILGYQYQPYTATGALLDPASELGDGVTVNDLYSGIFSLESTFGRSYTASISAPSEEEIDHEYPYTPKSERSVSRKLYQLSSDLRVQAGLISAEVQERKSDIESITGTLSVQAGEIQAKVSKSGGEAGSFEWVLDEDSWTIKSGGSNVFHVTKDEAELTGKITATSGRIGGFDINENCLSFNNQVWEGTNTSGAYIGIQGLQLGKNFRVDMTGRLYATDGEFTGQVRAGSIQYGGSNGYFNGAGISSHSITGGQYGSLNLGTISSVNLSTGINTSLGYADFANSVFNNIQEATYLRTKYLVIDKQMVTLSSVRVVDVNGAERDIRYLSW